MENIIEGEMLSPPIQRKAGESITMDFIDAMRKLLEGKKITRISWGNTDYCLMRDGWITIFTKDAFHTWAINDGDAEGQDWIIVKEDN